MKAQHFLRHQDLLRFGIWEACRDPLDSSPLGKGKGLALGAAVGPGRLWRAPSLGPVEVFTVGKAFGDSQHPDPGPFASSDPDHLYVKTSLTPEVEIRGLL